MFDREQNKFRTFGRAKGKPLSPAQSALMESVFPKIDVGPAVKAGTNPLADIDGPLWLEIGFGGAEHLLWQAKQNPDATLLGVEPFLNGVSKAVKGVHDGGLTNIRLHRGDARDVLDFLPNASLDRVFVLFPDPWPKTRHNKRRIINMKFIEDLHRVIKPGGRLRFASDIIHYVDWALTRIKRHGGFDWPAQERPDWRVRPDDWPSTRYLEKAIREDRSGHFFEFIRK
jgi:tRNA (guanine-N7-)-methyltransferase